MIPDSVQRGFYIFDIEAEMIQSRSYAGIPFEQRKPDRSVAYVPHIGASLSGLVTHAGGDLFHAKYALVKVRHFLVIFRIDRHMSDSSKHDWNPPF
jgi:hypothetical protein